MYKAVLITFLSLFQTSSALAQGARLTTLYDLVPKEDSYWVLLERQQNWLLNLTALAKKSTEFERLKKLAKNSDKTDECEVIFDVTSDGRIKNIDWSKKADSSKLSQAVLEFVQNMAPLRDVPTLIVGNNRVILSFKAAEELDIQASYAPKRLKF
jgi:hypothetical protein